LRAVPTACIEIVGGKIGPAPDDHLAGGPDSRVIGSAIGCVESGGFHPIISAGIILPAGVHGVRATIIAAPDDHVVASPDCRMKVSGSGSVGSAGRCPTIGAWIVSAAGVQEVNYRFNIKLSAPDDHFTVSPNCCVRVSAMGALIVLVAVQLSVEGLYLPPVLKYI